MGRSCYAVDICYVDGLVDECHLVLFPLSCGSGCTFVVAYDGGGGGVEDFVEVDIEGVVCQLRLGALPEGAHFLLNVVFHLVYCVFGVWF